MAGEIDTLGEQVAALEVALGNASAMAGAFDGELARLQDSLTFTSREVGTLSGGIGRGLRNAFDGLVLDGERLSDTLQGVAQSMMDTIYGVVTRPVTDALSGLIANGMQGAMSALMPFADGGVFSSGRVTPFARGGVVSSPTSFAMRGGRGLMGEAGPEAIMPLARGPDGRLGVQAAGGGRPVTVVMNIQTPDVAGFQRSQGQIAAEASRALARGNRNR
ncbi:MAG: phage tail protein [Cereibacter sphaeroides]|uniref:Phage tail protein n=1 Tax=Cereibacter sphaeroides TaxID=1063 RepID=A0A2W5U8S5_CERSP|nr:MAG: phage tail protein [Cereibacter sphaeroides]